MLTQIAALLALRETGDTDPRRERHHLWLEVEGLLDRFSLAATEEERRSLARAVDERLTRVQASLDASL